LRGKRLGVRVSLLGLPLCLRGPTFLPPGGWVYSIERLCGYFKAGCTPSYPDSPKEKAREAKGGKRKARNR